MAVADDDFIVDDDEYESPVKAKEEEKVVSKRHKLGAAKASSFVSAVRESSMASSSKTPSSGSSGSTMASPRQRIQKQIRPLLYLGPILIKNCPRCRG